MDFLTQDLMAHIIKLYIIRIHYKTVQTLVFIKYAFLN